MALIKCKECKKEISDNLRKCPNCGYTINRNISINILITFSLICSFIALTFGGVFLGDLILVIISILLLKKAMSLLKQNALRPKFKEIIIKIIIFSNFSGLTFSFIRTFSFEPVLYDFFVALGINCLIVILYFFIKESN